VKIKGVTYRYHSVDNDFYSSNGQFKKILVQANENDGTIPSIIGQSQMTEAECLLSTDIYRRKIEKDYGVEFSERDKNPFYLLTESNSMLMLGCEIKRNE